jgi:hypothetical protein
MRLTNDGGRTGHAAQQVSADEGEEHEERDELVGEPWRRGSGDGALHNRRAVQGFRPAAVQLRAEQVEDLGVGRRPRRLEQLHVTVARALGEAAGQDVGESSRYDLRPPPRQDAEHSRRAPRRARSFEPKSYGWNMIMIS